MPKRKRRDKQPTTSSPAPRPAPVAGTTDPASAPAPMVPAPTIDPAVALFAQRHQQGIDREKAAQRQRQAERDRLGEYDRLVTAKDAAVAAMKRVNRDGRSTPEDREAAEAAYRSATADLIAHETGERPGWAPAPPSDDTSAATLDPPPHDDAAGGSAEGGDAEGAEDEAGDDQPEAGADAED